MTISAQAAILTIQPDAAESLVGLLGAQQPPLTAGVYRDLVSLMAGMEHEPAAVVLVDVGADPMAMLDALEPVINSYVQSRFVVLAENLTGEVVMRAMQIGVRHVQRKSTLAAELPSVLQRLARGAMYLGAPLGKVYTILSAGGGCGSTTFAVNLANELQLATPESVLLVDLDYAYGAVATYLEIRSQYGIADVLRHTGTIDSHLVRTTAARACGNLYALLSPASINLSEARPIEASVLERIIPALKHGFGYTVVDAPRVPMDVAEALARASETTFVIMQPAVKDVRHAKAILTELASRGVPVERLKAVMNRYRRRRQRISLEDAQRALGSYSLECVSNDFANVSDSTNYGKPLSESAPRSAIRREFTAMAAHAAGLTNGKYRNG